MPDISRITLPSGTTYDIKDATARSQIAALTGGDAVVFIGVSSTVLTDGGNETPTVNNEQLTPATGQLFFYGSQEFIYGSDSKWHALGSLDTLGSLAYKNSATGTYNTVSSVSVTSDRITNQTTTVEPAASGEITYTPEGTITGITWTGAPIQSTGNFTPEGTVTTTDKTFSVSGTNVISGQTPTYTPAGTIEQAIITLDSAGATTTINNPASTTVAKTVVAVAPGATAPSNSLVYYSVANETLSLYQLGYTTGDSITTDLVTVKTGDGSYTASTQTFSGTGAVLSTDSIKEATGAFQGTQGAITVNGISDGTITQGRFNGTGVRLVTGNIQVPETYTATITTGTDTVTVS